MEGRKQVKKEVTLRFFGQLRIKTGSEKIKISLSEEISLMNLLKLLASENPGINALLVEGGEEIRPTYLIFINGVDSALLGGMNSVLKPGDIVDVVPISHGG